MSCRSWTRTFVLNGPRTPRRPTGLRTRGSTGHLCGRGHCLSHSAYVLGGHRLVAEKPPDWSFNRNTARTYGVAGATRCVGFPDIFCVNGLTDFWFHIPDVRRLAGSPVQTHSAYPSSVAQRRFLGYCGGRRDSAWDALQGAFSGSTLIRTTCPV